jgi:hypothetical protein
MTVTELAIASALLMVALAVTLGALSTFQSTQAFGDRRTQTLDSLRIASAAFSRDARQARLAAVVGLGPANSRCQQADVFCGDTLTFDTVVSGSPVQLVQWKFETVNGLVKLVRTDPNTGKQRIFADTLIGTSTSTLSSYFEYREVTAAVTAGTKPTIAVRLNTVPAKKDPNIGLTTKVALRNG